MTGGSRVEPLRKEFLMYRVLIAATLLSTVAMATPAAAQKNSVIVVYGEDECPKAQEGEDIIVCARRPEAERYRVPKRFRNKDVAPGNANESWAVRSEALNDASPVGINKCSVVGPAGWTGCYAQFVREAQAERRAQRRSEGAIPSVNDRPLTDGVVEDEEE
jgi:hypothetical protein